MRRVVVYHRGYGCMTGCCGHAIAVDPPQDAGDWTGLEEAEVPYSFEFEHGGDDLLQWAKAFIRRHLGAEHVADLDWEHCIVLTYDTCPTYG